MTSLYKTIRDRYARKGLSVTQEAVAQFITGQNSSLATVAGYATDTYLAGSKVILDPGSWRAGGVYRCKFDMAKTTTTGTATPIITVRLGTAGTTADTAIATITFAAGTAVADTGVFELEVVFRSVGSGTSAVVQFVAECRHILAATGLTTTGAAGVGVIVGTSSGFDSSKGSNLGISFNGGASFPGSGTLVRANYVQQ